MSNAGAFSSGGGGGGGIATINGDTGSATGNPISLLAATNCGASVSFSASGSTIDLNVSDITNSTIIGQFAGAIGPSGNGNVALGKFALLNCSGVINNVAIGNFALSSSTGAGNGSNVAVGSGALGALTTGSSNVGLGAGALGALTTGGLNIGIGSASGANYTTSEANNIVIGSPGAGADSGVIRIGTNPTHTTCYIQGIFGVTTSHAGSTTAVLIDTNGNLGTVASSIRYKENVKDMKDESSFIYALRPVTFHYKKDPAKLKQCGLIAEEVLKVKPELVVMSKEEPESVKYHDLPVLLLAEIQKLKAEIELLKKRLA